MRVNIICEDSGWIYSTFVKKFGFYSRNKIYLNSKEKCNVVYYLPYYLVPKVLPACPFATWQSHQELKDPIKTKFITAAKKANWCLSPSKKYLDLLKKSGINNVSQIHHGVDLNLYRPQKQLVGKKLVVGWVGRSYQSTSRKNEQLLKKISTLDFVDLIITGGKVKPEDMPSFYNKCNIMVSPSTVEGGPMCITESLSVGRPVLCYGNVGVADEFDHGVLRVGLGDEAGFLQRLSDFWKNKEYELFNQPDQQQLLRSQVETHTWENFVEDHDRCWESLA